ncbi:glycosyltransferase family 4 protein [uncultured Pseudodesulfovibrio sp.]|uniref:glycosyltransferase family 4 protein n=1 Tax=uncultured Pseudodesulfovibrio sp. TaxID=2035858 RepID=UPI0029C67B90|nr:glycosyltransferase family 4 protein [uncultured Pseudodesulfovibrio sp.]
MNPSLSDTHLILFMTYGMSLAEWDALGMFDRELAVYKKVLPHLKKITIVSYGGKEDAQYAKPGEPLSVICNRFGLPLPLYTAFLTKLLPYTWKSPCIVKTNQMRGGDIALTAARKAKAGFIARCGFLHSVHATNRNGADSPEARAAVALEEMVFPSADLCVVSSEHMLETVLERGAAKGKTTVVPNYIVEPWFPQVSIAETVKKIYFAGRFEKQKNIMNMLKALKGLDAEIHLIGEGSQLPEAQDLARELGLNAHFQPRIPHKQLIQELSKADIYLQPSRYEGHPKTILEAMALGLPVIAGNSVGIANFMEHEKTGYLCEMNADAIRDAVDTLIASRDLRATLGKNAREYVFDKTGLNNVSKLELQAYKRVLGI